MRPCEAKRFIKNYFDEIPDGEDPVSYFINYFYNEKGLSLTEISDYIIGNKSHATILRLADTHKIPRQISGGNVYKYKKVMRCLSCSYTQDLFLLTRNAVKHKSLELKCKKCGGVLK